MNIGGWHDAGDFDLRIESQAGESYILALAYEAFHPNLDVTSIDQINRVTEIHQPDGKNDLLQQVENGALTVVNGYLALGRLYRGIICNDLRQYVLLGDAAAMTDGKSVMKTTVGYLQKTTPDENCRQPPNLLPYHAY